MHLALILSTNDPETAHNALRLAHFALTAGDHATVFLLGAGVEIASIPSEPFAVAAKAREVLHAGGEVLACGTCLQRRGLGPSGLYHVSDMKALRDLIAAADRVISFG